MRGGERFYSQGWRPSQVFPYKEKSTGYSGGWCPRAPCGYLIGPGCRGSVSGSLASLRNFVCGIFLGHASTCPTFHFLFFLTFSLNIFVSFIFISLFPNWHLALVLFSSLCFSQFCSHKHNFRFPLFAGSIFCTLFLLDCCDFAYGYIYVYIPLF